MPQVPQYQIGNERVAPLNTPKQNPGAAGDFGAGAIARGGQDLAAGVNDVAKAIDLHQQKQAALDAQTAFVAASDEERAWAAEAAKRQGKNAVGLEKDGDAAFGEIRRRHGEGLSPRASQAFGAMMESRRGDFLDGLSRREAQEFQAYQAETTRAMIDNAISDASANPALVGKSRARILAAISANNDGSGEEALRAKSRAALTALHGGVIENMMQSSPSAALKYLDANKGEIEGTKLGDIRKAIRIEADRQESERNQRNAGAVSDFVQRAGDYADWVTAGNAPSSDFSREKIVSVLGPEKGTKVADSIERAEHLGSVFARLKSADPKEVEKIKEEYAAELSGESASDGDPWADYSAKQKEAASFSAALDQRNKALSADGAGYALTTSPNVMEAWNGYVNAGNDPQLLATGARQYATAVLAEQARLGVPADKRRILPVSIRDGIVSKFKSSDATEQAALSVQLAEQWGANWPRVYGEMSKDMPSTALVMGSGIDSETASRLAEASTIDRKELLKALPSSTSSELRTKLASELSDFHATLASSVNGQETFSTWWDETEKLALYYMSQGESDAGSAARHAANDIVNKYFDFRGSYRVPKAFDADSVEGGAERIMGKITASDIAPVVVDLQGADPKKAQASNIGDIKRRGEWVNAPNGEGLILQVDGRNVRRPDGSPFYVSFKEMTGAYDSRDRLDDLYIQGKDR